MTQSPDPKEVSAKPMRLDNPSLETKIAAIQRARTQIRSGVKDIDPEIGKLVNDNFEELLWK
jgi:hypothetical protein